MTDIALPQGADSPGPQGGGRLATAPLERVRTYWDMVWRTFVRGRLNRMATIWVAMIVLLSIFVPFVANDKPYSAILNGRREYPLVRDLTRVDWIVLVIAACGAAYAWHYRRLAKGVTVIEDLRRKRFISFLLAAGVALIVSLGILAFKNDYLDGNDYHALARAGKIQDATFAPLHWGYGDSEPLEANKIFELPPYALARASHAGAGDWIGDFITSLPHNSYLFFVSEHRLGTDGNGRDALARLLWGARVVLAIGLVSEVIALVIGVIYGALMGYFVGAVDILGMRFVEIVEAIPLLFLLITFVALFGRDLFMLMVIIGLTGWTGIARFVRAEFLRIRNLDYVTAAKAAGLPLGSILFRHMLPNGLTPVIVTFTFGVAGNVGSESILSFLGIGVEPPTPSWGAMLNEAGNPAETFRWWLAIAPGLLIFLTVFAYNIIGEGLRDAIDPRTKG